MGLGLGLVFTLLAIVGAAGLGVSGFMNALETIAEGHGDPGLQVISGLALSVALAAGAVAIVGLHLHGD